MDRTIQLKTMDNQRREETKRRRTMDKEQLKLLLCKKILINHKHCNIRHNQCKDINIQDNNKHTILQLIKAINKTTNINHSRIINQAQIKFCENFSEFIILIIFPSYLSYILNRM